MKLSKTAIIIPAYNEEKNISKIVKLSKKISNNIIVIDDGSKDKTSLLAKKAGATVIKHKKNKGKGEGLKTAFRYFSKKKGIDYVTIIDADLQFLPKDIPKLIKPLKSGKADIVVGMRNWKTVPFRNRVGNFVWRTTFNVLYGTRMKDTNCGLMAIKISVLNKLKIGGGYIVENMMLASAVKNKLKIKQVPVDVNYNVIHGPVRGSRVVLAVLFYTLKSGIRYRLGLD